MRVPTMMLAAGNDDANVKENGVMHQALLQHSGVPAGDHYFEEFATMKHGWTNRGDLNDAHVRSEVERSLCLVERFFGEHIARVGAGGGGGSGGAAALVAKAD
jgi:hypothetical protein